jgi:hypothetical protein
MRRETATAVRKNSIYAWACENDYWAAATQCRENSWWVDVEIHLFTTASGMDLVQPICDTANKSGQSVKQITHLLSVLQARMGLNISLRHLYSLTTRCIETDSFPMRSCDRISFQGLPSNDRVSGCIPYRKGRRKCFHHHDTYISHGNEPVV